MSEVKLILQCCRCRRIKVNDGWEKEIKSQLEDVRYSHGHCPECIEVEIMKMDRQFAAREVELAG